MNGVHHTALFISRAQHPPPHPLGLGDPGQGYVEGPDQAIPTLEEGFIHGREGKGRRCCLGDSIY